MWNTGNRVLANRPPDDFWYPATIRHIKDDRYFVIYDDGEDGFVSAKQMMPLNLEVGARLFAQRASATEYQPAEIIDKQGDDLHVAFDAGGMQWTPPAKVRVQPGMPHKSSPQVQELSWTIGDRVLACWFDLFWYTGAILSVEGSQVKVVFDHGGFAHLPGHHVHALELMPGLAVQGRWRAGPEFYPGKIDRIDGEIAHVVYDDGDEETTLIRLLRVERDDWLPDPGEQELGTGDRVFGLFFDGFWYPGIILSIDHKRLHVLFDDNDQAKLTWEKVKPLELSVGDRIFCRWKGGEFYFAGEIKRKKGERIFVNYDDGREEWTSVRLVRVEG